jgi:hypothetical protein
MPSCRLVSLFTLVVSLFAVGGTRVHRANHTAVTAVTSAVEKHGMLRASSSSKCADWSGKWYKVKGSEGGRGVFPVSQVGCDVTVENGMSLTYYRAKGNKLKCMSYDVKGSRCATYYRNISEGAVNPATLVLDEAKTTATNLAGDTIWRKRHTYSCPQPSTDCYRHWAGSWKSSSGKFTVEQDGCRITKKQWTSSFERALHYTACGNIIIPDRDFEPIFKMSDNGKKVTCLQGAGPGPCKSVWTQTAPDPPRKPLPSCLPEGGCPIMFANGTRPPCCNGGVTVRDWGGACDGKIGEYGYPTSGSRCAKCLPYAESCIGRKNSCCNGLRCIYQGISGSNCLP